MRQILLTLFGFALLGTSLAQTPIEEDSLSYKIIELNNPSFEDEPHQGQRNGSGPKGWYACNFTGESAPDIHTGSTRDSSYWTVDQDPVDGETYLGMVTRDNDTWERMSQRINPPLKKGQCYQFSISLCKSSSYLSISASARDSSNVLNMPLDSRQVQFTQPVVFRIWGNWDYCLRSELLAESQPVNNTDWKVYEFEFTPVKDHNYLMLESFYKTPTLFPYNGNLLLDNASNVIPIDCATKLPLAEPAIEQIVTAPSPPNINVPDLSNGPEESIPNPSAKKEKILKDLQPGKLRVGQTIRIDQLYFAADTSAIGQDSYEVLDEILLFMAENKEVVVEIGGHTNMTPDPKYADWLSKARADTVVAYLAERGIDNRRLYSKGYGKRRPVTRIRTREAQKKNQRVEIKVLSVTGI